MADEQVRNPYDETAPLSREWFKWELADVARRQYEMKVRSIARLYRVRDCVKNLFRKKCRHCGVRGHKGGHAKKRA